MNMENMHFNAEFIGFSQHASHSDFFFLKIVRNKVTIVLTRRERKFKWQVLKSQFGEKKSELCDVV